MAHCFRPERGRTCCLSRSGSQYAKSIFTAISTIRDIRFLSWIGDDVCRCAGPGSDASTSIQYWHESENGGHYGRFSDSLDLLRTTDRFSTRCRMEHDCSV